MGAAWEKGAMGDGTGDGGSLKEDGEGRKKKEWRRRGKGKLKRGLTCL